MRSGFLTIVGPANAGKSTLLNALLKTPLTIVSSKPQTTRNSIAGILTDHQRNIQLVITDTPGMLKKCKSLLDKKLQESILGSVQNTDVVLFLLPSSEDLVPYQELLTGMQEQGKKILVIFNKMDEKKKILSPEETALGFSCLFISALQKQNLDSLLDRVSELLTEEVQYYPEDILSDRTERFFVKEYIREAVLNLLNSEIPHQIFVDVEEMSPRPEKNLHYIKAILYLERENHKKIVLGKNGDMIKALGSAARKRIEEFLEQKVFLELQVKVKENWREDPAFLEKLEYY